MKKGNVDYCIEWEMDEIDNGLRHCSATVESHFLTKQYNEFISEVSIGFFFPNHLSSFLFPLKEKPCFLRLKAVRMLESWVCLASTSVVTFQDAKLSCRSFKAPLFCVLGVLFSVHLIRLLSAVFRNTPFHTFYSLISSLAPTVK